MTQDREKIRLGILVTSVQRKTLFNEFSPGILDFVI